MEALNRTISRKHLVAATLLYLGLPLVIFFLGWLRPIYAALAVLPLILLSADMVRSWPEDSAGPGLKTIVATLLFCMGLAAFVGVGGLGWQQFDWYKHNAVMHELINHPWPVYLQDGDRQWALVYYVGYYLPAALVGRVWGYGAAQFALWVWTSLGATLACLWFGRLTALRPATAFGFFLFCGLDVLGVLITRIPGVLDGQGLYLRHLDRWASVWEFPSPYYTLEWSPGQGLAAWLPMALLLDAPPALQLPAVCLGVTAALIWSPFAALGIIILVCLLWASNPRLELLRFSRTTWALLASLALSVCALVAFYATKLSPDLSAHFDKIPITLFVHAPMCASAIASSVALVIFVFCDFGLLVWILVRHFSADNEQRRMAVCCSVALALLLPVTVGVFNDLALRGSAAPFFCLAVLAARGLKTGPPKSRRLLAWCLAVGALMPLLQASAQGYRDFIHRPPPKFPQPRGIMDMPEHQGVESQYLGSTNTFFYRSLARGTQN
jgi:hypothetical protein